MRSHSFPASEIYQTYRSGRPIKKSHRIHYRSKDEFSELYIDPYNDGGDDSFFAREVAPQEEKLVEKYENPLFYSQALLEPDPYRARRSLRS